MSFILQRIQLRSQAPIEVIEITEQVREQVRASSQKNGLVHVASQHTTMALALNESCEALNKDIQRFLSDLAPSNDAYDHNRVAVDGRPNAHSHLLSLLLPSEVTIALRDGVLQLGRWQAVFAIELDGPRPERTIHINILGASADSSR